MKKKTTKDYNKEYYSRPDVKEAHAKYMKDYYQKNKQKIIKKQIQTNRIDWDFDKKINKHQ